MLADEVAARGKDGDPPCDLYYCSQEENASLRYAGRLKFSLYPQAVAAQCDQTKYYFFVNAGVVLCEHHLASQAVKSISWRSWGQTLLNIYCKYLTVLTNASPYRKSKHTYNHQTDSHFMLVVSQFVICKHK